jgi:hypothetical protein
MRLSVMITPRLANTTTQSSTFGSSAATAKHACACDGSCFSASIVDAGPHLIRISFTRFLLTSTLSIFQPAFAQARAVRWLPSVS